MYSNLEGRVESRCVSGVRFGVDSSADCARQGRREREERDHQLKRRANIRAVPKHPPHLKIQRAKVIVDDEGQKFLGVCDSCGREVYLAEDQTLCDECKARPKRKRKVKF
jgi:hypothetical protein